MGRLTESASELTACSTSESKYERGPNNMKVTVRWGGATSAGSTSGALGKNAAASAASLALAMGTASFFMAASKSSSVSELDGPERAVMMPSSSRHLRSASPWNRARSSSVASSTRRSTTHLPPVSVAMWSSTRRRNVSVRK